MADTCVLRDHDHAPVAVHDQRIWRDWMRNRSNLVASDQVGLAVFRTKFVGVDMRSNFHEGKPLLFETRVTWMGEPLVDEQRRYATWDEAVQGHADQVLELRRKIEN